MNKIITPEKMKHQAEMLSNRVLSRFRFIFKRYKRLNIDCFRLYDWDIPEIRVVVDWYSGNIVIAEYERLQTGPDWLPFMAESVGKALEVPFDKIFMKHRHTRKQGEERYSKPGSQGKTVEVKERNLCFIVNLSDYLDTGLFSDHRNTRLLISEIAPDKDFLNLFAYTGAFTCAAAAGKAKSTVTVDQSKTYIKWAKKNMELNGFSGVQHKYVQSDAGIFLDHCRKDGHLFNLSFVDPPSFFSYRSNDNFDINKDHPQLLEDVLSVISPGGTIFFSTNHQRFEPSMERLKVTDLVELTPDTIPEDYRNRKIHRCWKIVL